MSAQSSSSSRLKKVRCKKWDMVHIPSIDDLEAMTEREIQSTPLPRGFCVRFLCHDMVHLFTVASIQVRVTRGALDYLHDYNQLGPNKSRNKLFLCSQYNKTKECVNGSLCRELHCVLNVEDAQDALRHLVPSNATGAPNIVTLAPAEEIIAKRLNEPFAAGTAAPAFSNMENSNPLDSILGGSSAVDGTASIYMPDQLILRHSLHTRWTSSNTYLTLPSGVEFRVALPNTPTPVEAYDSGLLFVTRGAQEYFSLCMRNEQPTVTMQHCAHYSKNGICCFGEHCQFVHVVHYKARDRTDNSISDPDAVSMGSSTTNCESSRRHSVRRVSALTRTTPLNTAATGRKKVDSLISSRSASSNRDTSTPHQKAMQMPSSSGLSTPGNHVFVPPTNAWHTMGATPSCAAALRLPPPPPAQHFPPDSIMIPTMPPQPSPLMGQTYMVMQDLNGQCYIVPHSAPSIPQAGQPGPSQPLYVMSMPFH